MRDVTICLPALNLEIAGSHALRNFLQHHLCCAPADRLYTSRSKLCAAFKAETGESIGAYVRRRRTERACDLLAGSSLPVGQIAERLGYPQQAAFAQAFKQETGLSPTAWRAAKP